MMVGEGYTADFLDGSLRRDKATVPAVSSLLVSLLAESSSGFLVAKRTAWDTSMVPASLWLILACLVAASGLERTQLRGKSEGVMLSRELGGRGAH